MVQACISRCIESAVLCDEFFLQLVRMTTTGPRARCSPKESLEIWKLFWCVIALVRELMAVQHCVRGGCAPQRHRL